MRRKSAQNSTALAHHRRRAQLSARFNLHPEKANIVQCAEQVSPERPSVQFLMAAVVGIFQLRRL